MSHAEPIHVEFVEVQGTGHVRVYLGEKEKLPQRPYISRYIRFSFAEWIYCSQQVDGK